MSLENVSKNIERCYEHPNLSPWHVREALRGIFAEVRSNGIEAAVKLMTARAERDRLLGLLRKLEASHLWSAVAGFPLGEEISAALDEFGKKGGPDAVP